MKLITEPALEQLAEMINTVQVFRDDMKHYIRSKLKESNLDITFEMLEVLIVLWQKDRQNQQEIATAVRKNKASITPLIDNLEARNLVSRQTDPTDRRNKIIYLTKEGINYGKKAMEIGNEFYGRLNGSFSVSQIEKTTQMLKGFIVKLKE